MVIFVSWMHISNVAVLCSLLLVTVQNSCCALPQNTSNHIFEHSAKGIPYLFFATFNSVSLVLYTLLLLLLLLLLFSLAASVLAQFVSCILYVNVFDGRCEFQAKITQHIHWHTDECTDKDAQCNYAFEFGLFTCT